MSEMFQSRRSSIYQKNPGNEDDVDLLSNLPDSIICLIISKLKTKEAVKTSVLSSRYKSLWVNITSLSFSCYEFINNVKFAHFVNSVLSLLKSKSIYEFLLSVEPSCHLYDIPSWLSTAIYMNVKVVTLLILKGKKVISMPACLYTSKTLEVLQLSGAILNVPEFVSLPKLTQLTLQHVNYSSDDSVRRLISGCSSLEYLFIMRDTFDGVTTFTISSPTLKTLHYYFSASDNGSIEQDFKFELNAPALRDLQLSDDGSRDFSVVNLYLPERAKIVVSSPRGVDPESHYERVMKHLQGFFNVNHLWISGHTLEWVHLATVYHQRLSPVTLDSWKYLLRMDTNYSERSLLQDLLDPSTESHGFYLSKDSSDTGHVVQWSTPLEYPLELPVCLLSCLKTISVSGFKGWESELSMIAYIMENAKVLKKITINETISEVEAKLQLREKILKFDRGSERCEIIFS